LLHARAIDDQIAVADAVGRAKMDDLGVVVDERLDSIHTPKYKAGQFIQATDLPESREGALCHPGSERFQPVDDAIVFRGRHSRSLSLIKQCSPLVRFISTKRS